MTIDEAATLIRSGIQAEPEGAMWADLGCGSGTFTTALATLLGEHSRIYAIDKVDQIIESRGGNNVDIKFAKIDFINDALPVTNLDGILMANSLHYVKEKDLFIKKLSRHLKPAGQVIIVEYDTEHSNQWVPYPISFTSLQKTFAAAAFSDIKKIGERKSIYRTGKMYAAAVSRK